MDSTILRGRPIPDSQGDELLQSLLAEIEEEDRLGALLGIDLTPPGPDRTHAPPIYPPLAEWLRRSEEVHRFLERAYRAKRRGAAG